MIHEIGIALFLAYVGLELREGIHRPCIITKAAMYWVAMGPSSQSFVAGEQDS